jgi:hypothetical protein
MPGAISNAALMTAWAMVPASLSPWQCTAACSTVQPPLGQHLLGLNNLSVGTHTFTSQTVDRGPVVQPVYLWPVVDGY